MSGGKFEYSQSHFESFYVEPFARELREMEEYRLMAPEAIDALPEDEKWSAEYARELKDETIKEFRKGLIIMRAAVVFAQRIDWFLSGDDGEESFHERLEEELEVATISERNITNNFLPNPGQKTSVFDARSEFCRCVYAVGYDNEGYEEWKTIYTIETKEGYRRQHHADRMIKYLKKGFYGTLGSTVTINDAAKALTQKHKIVIYDDYHILKPKSVKAVSGEKFSTTTRSNTITKTRIEK